MVTARPGWPIARRKPGRLRPSCIHARPVRPPDMPRRRPAAGRGARHWPDTTPVISVRPHRPGPSGCRHQHMAHRQSRGGLATLAGLQEGSTPWMKVDSSIARAPWPCHSAAAAGRPSAASASSRDFCSTSFCTAPSARRCRAARSAAGDGVAAPGRRCPLRYRRHPAALPGGHALACPTLGQVAGGFGQSFGVVAVHGRSGRLHRRDVD